MLKELNRHRREGDICGLTVRFACPRGPSPVDHPTGIPGHCYWLNNLYLTFIDLILVIIGLLEQTTGLKNFRNQDSNFLAAKSS